MIDDNIRILKYWIEERESIRYEKEKLQKDKPWSDDPIFQNTYFCNVKRENDKVTKWIRNFYSPYVNDPMFETNMVLARLINWPDTLEKTGYWVIPAWEELQITLEQIEGKVWGDAYIVSTNGAAMPKTQYVCEVLMPGIWLALREPCRNSSLEEKHKDLMKIRGLGSFMAAQVVADLKNTDGHPLTKAKDWWSWAAPGPGSKRGLSWLLYNDSEHSIPGYQFIGLLHEVRADLIQERCELVKGICHQDLQNCLCEFDKYMRIKNGTGRSKRGYNGR